MRVAFDHQIFACQREGGISRYFCMLSKELTRLGLAETLVAAPENRCRLLAEAQGAPCTELGVAEALKAGREAALPQLAAFAPHVLHETYFTGYETGWKAGPLVTTVYDMIHEKMPHLCHPGDRTAEHKKAALDRVLDRGGAVICISGSTRRDLLECHDLPEERVHVVHLGVARPEDLRPASREGRPFVLFVGNRGGYKNFATLAKAMGMAKAGRELDLVCAGGGPFTAEESALNAAGGLRAEQVDCDDGGLWSLYASARLMAYPSPYEGFGLPVLEAMSANCPVVCSNGTSLPEVAGDAALLTDTTSPEALAEALDLLAFDSGLRGSLKRKGRERAAMFTWRACAEKTATVYCSLVNKRDAA